MTIEDGAVQAHRRAALREVASALDVLERIDQRQGLRAIAAQLGRFA